MSHIEIMEPEHTASVVAEFWDRYNFDRQAWLERGMEARKYVTTPDTTFTEVGLSLPWKNKTTIPKLTHIVDNLCSYYMAALMPTDDWFRWEGSDEKSREKAPAVEAYMRTKLLQSDFISVIEKVVRDWVMFGNCLVGAYWTKEYITDRFTQQPIINYMGPKAFQVSPFDFMLNPRAASFDTSPMIRRTVVSMIELMEHNSKTILPLYDEAAVEQTVKMRAYVDDQIEELRRIGFQIDGFNDIGEYLQSGYVELLEYWGDVWNPENNTYETNRHIVVADRHFVLVNQTNPAWNGKKPYAFCNWRILPGNIYGQSPIDNLVGMQYRCDHLENLKADAFDQIVHPMIKVKGDNVEDFQSGPGARIYCGTDGDVEYMHPDPMVLNCDNQIDRYHQYMELMAGVPKEVMGFRTPGEKTAFEVSALMQAADRAFMDKLRHFEKNIIEPLLNIMLELAIRNLDVVDAVRVNAENAEIIMQITKDDIVANGTLRPVGSTYFATRSKRIQELQNFLLISQNPKLAPHVSGMQSAKMFSEELGLEKWGIVAPNVGLIEAFQQQILMMQMKQQMQQMLPQEEAGSGIPTEDDMATRGTAPMEEGMGAAE